MSCFEHVLYSISDSECMNWNYFYIIMIYIPGGHPPWPADHDGGHHCGLHPCQHPPHTRLQRPEVAQSAGELATLKTSVLNSTIWLSRRCPGSCSTAAASWPASGPTSTTPHSAGGRRRSVEVNIQPFESSQYNLPFLHQHCCLAFLRESNQCI